MKVTEAVGYRVGQFLRALTARRTLSKERIRRAMEILSPQERRLFERQAPQDQLHAVVVCETLLEKGKTNRDLLAAALLHDVGKAVAPAAPWQRGVFVVAERFVPGTLTHILQQGDEDEDGALAVYAEHAEIGARWAEEVGCSSLTVELIRRHERQIEDVRTEVDRLLAALQAADNVS